MGQTLIALCPKCREKLELSYRIFPTAWARSCGFCGADGCACGMEPKQRPAARTGAASRGGTGSESGRCDDGGVYQNVRKLWRSDWFCAGGKKREES